MMLRLRACLMASLAIIIAALLSTVSAKQECVQIREEHELRHLARNDNVFLMVSDDETAHVPKDICNKLGQHAISGKKISPNGSTTVFAHLEASADNRNFVATALNVGQFPSFATPTGLTSPPTTAMAFRHRV